MKVPARGNVLISTDLQIQLPEGCYGRIAPCSGLALKHYIDIGGCVIDQDYCGNLNVILYNHSDIPITVSGADRIAQLICYKIYYTILEAVKILDITDRCVRGFGSAG